MENLPLIELSELNKNIIVRDSFQDIFSIADLDGGLDVKDEARAREYMAPVRLNALLMVLALEGTSEVCLDYVPYTIGPNCFVMIMPTHTIQLNKVSKDFRGRLIIASKNFIEGCNPGNRGSSVANYMEIKKNPCTTITSEECAKLEAGIQMMRDKMKERSHFFQKELIQNAFICFLLEIANVFMGKKDSLTKPVLSRKEELFEQFLQLLFDHCKEKHVVTFYAEKLFITPQYLSLILKEITGKSANKWIDDALIVEAKILLKAPQATVQQVADILHFSDQSTFGKFFKKHMGVSPMEYRKS